MVELEYLTDKKGQVKAVVIPIEIWKKFFPINPPLEEFSEEREDYCLGKAMDQAKDSPLLNHKEALTFLED